MEFIEKMRANDKRELKVKLINLLDNFNEYNFKKEISKNEDIIKELASRYSYKIDLAIGDTYIQVYIDDKLVIYKNY